MVKYIANMDIGEFKKGSVVPEENALVWINMYLVSPIDIVKDNDVHEKVDLDVNDDGKVDAKDFKIMGKALGKRGGRKSKGKKNK